MTTYEDWNWQEAKMPAFRIARLIVAVLRSASPWRPLVFGLAGLFWAASAQAAPVSYYAILSGLNENPPNGSAGTGLTLVTIDTVAHFLSVEVSFSGLTGTTTASHIHCCVVPPGNVGVATQTPTFFGFPLGVTAGNYSNTFDLTLASSFNPAFVTANGGIAGAEAALAAGLDQGRAYLNIHTTWAPGGEIRGFLQPIPEPATLSLLGLAALAGTAWRMRRRIGR